MTICYLQKPLYTLLIVLTCLTTYKAQTKTKTQTENKSEPTAFPAGHAKLLKTQGSKEADNVCCSLQDKAGNLWFGTTGEGLYRYDGKTFVQFTKQDGLNSNCLYSILEDKEGNIWLGTDNGVCYYNGKTFSNVPITIINDYNLYPNQSSNNNTSTKNAVWAMLQDKTGKIWFGTTMGVYYYDGKKTSRFLDNVNLINNQYLQLKWIQCFLEDSSGTIWMGSGPIAMEGVIRYDGKSLTAAKPNGDGWIRYIFKDKTETIWFGGRWEGNFIYDGKTFKIFTEKKGIGNTILSDRAGNIWFTGAVGTDSNESKDGIWCYDGKKFSNYSLKEGMGKNFVHCMMEDKAGNIWIGTRNNGLYKYNGKSFTCFSE